MGAALGIACAPRPEPPRRVTVVLVDADRFAMSAALRPGAQQLELRDVSGQAHLLRVAGRDVALAAHQTYVMELDLSAGEHQLTCETHETRRIVAVQ